MNQAIALPPNILEIIEEADRKIAAVPALLAEVAAMRDEFRNQTTVMGAYNYQSSVTNPVDMNPPSDQVVKAIRGSGWMLVAKFLRVVETFPSSKLKAFEQSMADPPELTIENVIATFGEYAQNPRMTILSGLAEQFGRLDSAYKSHRKVAIGVKGLPKRVVLTATYFPSDMAAKLTDMIRPLGMVCGYPQMTSKDAYKVIEGERDEWHGLTFKRYQNGNIHVMFDKFNLKRINECLHEFYGDVLPDAEDDGHKPANRMPSRDLQYYPTPVAVAKKMAESVDREGNLVLEPSCGCGRLLDQFSKATTVGVEIHEGRAAQARAKGHHVIVANFLEMEPNPIYDAVIMNPPFSGKHYQKHIEHAKKFLKPRGRLKAVLPASAYYDHDYLPKIGWSDLPLGSFRESGTNVCTGIFEWVNV